MKININTLNSLQYYMINTHKSSVAHQDLSRTSLQISSEDFNHIRSYDLADASNGLANHEELTRRDLLKAIGSFNKPLFDAVRNNDTEALAEQLNQIGDINVPNQDGENVLHRAVYTKNLKMINLLLKHGANINAQDSRGNTPLHLAFESADVTVAEHLLKQGANPLIPNDLGQTVFFTAVSSGYIHLIKALLVNKPELRGHVNDTDKNGNTVLHFAAANKMEDIYKFLIKLKAKPGIKK